MATDPNTGLPIPDPTPVVTDPAPVVSAPAPTPKEQLQSFVDAWAADLDALKAAHKASTDALVAQATANAQVASTAAAETQASTDASAGLTNLKNYVDALNPDGTPTPASAAALQA